VNRLVRTELLKQRTTRTFVTGVAAAPVVAVLITIAMFGAAGTQGNEPLQADSLKQALGAPSTVVPVIALVLGLLAMTGEHRHQTITTTFLACPRRKDVVLAKLAAASLVGGALGVLSLAGSAALAVPWLRASGVSVDVDADIARIAIGFVLGAALYGALGVAVGALVRNQAAAITVVLVWLLAVEGIIGDVFSRSAFVRWMPAAAGWSLTHDGAGALSMPVAIGVLAAYAGAFTLTAVQLTVRRDVS
jgi:ABC-2 type transport system permease protein